MSALVDSILANLGDDQVRAIATRLGTDPAQARNAIEQAIPLIVGGMAHNARSAQGAGALHDALGAHVGFDMSSVLGSVLNGNGLGGNTSGIGGAILGHIFGANRGAADQGLGQVTGLGQQNAGQLMAILAPLVMAYLANHVQNQGLDSGGLGGLLGQQSQQLQQRGGVVGGLLSAVLNHGGGNLDLSHLVGGPGGLLGAFTRH